MPRKFVFQDFKASGCPKSLFFKFFELRDSPKACFSDFSSFGTPRKRIFQFFRVSGLPESVFFKFFELRGPPTVHFHKKRLVGASRNLIFLNFSLSGCPEAQFFLNFWLSLLREALLSRRFCFQASLFSCPQSRTIRRSFVGGELYPDVPLKAEAITVVGITGVCRACPIGSHVTKECSS